ncbi:NAD-dependent epimerase/dehydratase family protein [Rhodovulum adriaticum]|uniref:Nucleoside-diphosphate-sugar epimerase n=1 Tax=Rhodovulum adriaticum TaxID=35804 RepID=A0A4V2SM69_RHOAD|nr:SDR family oxidoreductase [Rhodovulum adriaticum]MBK1635617.1 UDP-glucose 4-epimerase [Rhodovulum adriaticum]TCP26146.1 nucleoside-diphosphate-sugar epimerase [Rhodovulum adriaticum]
MSLAVTGATGLVGRFFVEEALARGEPVAVLTRRAPPPGFFSAPVAHRPYTLGERPDLAGHNTVIHCAFAHVPGRYRGGEGDDPEGFARANLDGSVALFQAARACGVQRVLFLSTRAVYGAYPPGTVLTDDMAPRPDTLYGQVKWQAEQALFAMAAPEFVPVSLRATGVYGPAGPGQRHKWADLFDDFRAGRPIAPRRGTELHGADLAEAGRLLRNAPTETVSARAFNLSDILLDRRDLLALLAKAEGLSIPLPAPSDAPVSAMDCNRMQQLGWVPGGLALLRNTLPALR